jgi:hypothetical protein
MSSRTIRDFQVGFDISQAVDGWAAANDYTLREVLPDGTRRYQRGHGLLVLAMPLTIRQSGNNVHLEAWVHASLWSRVGSFFLLPADLGIESGSFRGVLPRNIARGAVNQLLVFLGQPPIV